MENKAQLDKQAIQVSKEYIGDVAWPTVILGLAIIASYLATPALVISGSMPLAAAVVLMAFLTYAAYTVLHEAAHGSISGSKASLRWLNEAMGYMAAWIVMIPLTAHRHEHLAHHRNTNVPEADPDHVVSNIFRSPAQSLAVIRRVFFGQYSYYFKYRWNKGPRSQNVYLCLETLMIAAPRLAFFASGYWLEGLALLVLAWLLGIGLLLYLFAYIVHVPHNATGRYLDTSTFVIGGPLGHLATWLWGFQNYHSVHHLFPRVPFYSYRQVFERIEPTMLAHGAPVFYLQSRGFKQVEASATH